MGISVSNDAEDPVLRYVLSSKSLKRFLVNFHTKKAMIAMTATPPATDIPMIGPIPIPLLGALSSSLLLEVVEGAALLVEDEVVVTVRVTSTPAGLVETDRDVGGGGGGVLVGGASGVGVDVGVSEDLLVSEGGGILDVVDVVVGVDVGGTGVGVGVGGNDVVVGSERGGGGVDTPPAGAVLDWRW